VSRTSKGHPGRKDRDATPNFPVLEDSLEIHSAGSFSRERIHTNPNVRLVSRSDRDEHFPERKKFSLADMLKNAKKVEKHFVQPYAQKCMDEGIIPCTYWDEHLDGVDSKFKAFARKQDKAFERKFGEQYHDFRKAAWTKINSNHNMYKAEYVSPLARRLRSSDMAFDTRFISLYVPDDASRRFDIRIKLPLTNFRLQTLSAWESVLAASGKIPAIPDFLHQGELDYSRSFDIDEAIIFHSELSELKYIYRTWWYADSCKTNWLHALYSHEDVKNTKILGFQFSKVSSPTGMYLEEDMVIYQIDGTIYTLSVDELFKWIVWTRDLYPRSEPFAIGEPSDDYLLLYAILISAKGGTDFEIMNNLNHDVIRSNWESILREIVQVSDQHVGPDHTSGTQPSWLDAMIGIGQTLSLIDPITLELGFFWTDIEYFNSCYPQKLERRLLHANVAMVDTLLLGAQLDTSEASASVSRETQRSDNTLERILRNADEAHSQEGSGSSKSGRYSSIASDGLVHQGLSRPGSPSQEEISILPLRRPVTPVAQADRYEHILTADEEFKLDMGDPSTYRTILNPVQHRIAAIWGPRCIPGPYIPRVPVRELRIKEPP